MLTVKSEVVPEVHLHNILARDGVHVRARSHGLLADGQTNHGSVVNQLLQGGLLARDLLLHHLVDVVRNEVASMHGAAAPLDARPLSSVATAEVHVRVGRLDREAEVRLDLDVALLVEGGRRQVRGGGLALGDGHDDLASGDLGAVGELDLDVRGPVRRLEFLGAGEAVLHEDLDAGLEEQLKGLVLAVVLEVLGRQELRSRVDERDLGIGLDELELSGHLDTDGAASHDHDAVAGVGHGVDVVLSLEEVLLPAQGLGHDGPDSPQARSADEVVIFMDARELCSVVDDGCGAGGGVDGRHSALDDGDLRPAEGGDVGVLDPGLLRVGGVCEGEGRPDEMD